MTSRRFRLLALAVAVLGVAGAAGLLLTGTGPARARTATSVRGAPGPVSTTTAGVATPSGPAAHAPVAGPRGWKPGDDGDLRVWVPRHWAIFEPGTGGGGNDPALLLGAAIADDIHGPTVHLTALRSVPTIGRRLRINGYTVVSPRPGVWDVPALHGQITEHGSVPAGILDSLGPSPLAVVTARGPAAPVPPGWRTVVYRGLAVDVPATWPVESVAHAGACGDYWGARPAVFVGSLDLLGAPSCPGGVGSLPVNGLLLDPGQGPRKVTAESTPQGFHPGIETAVALTVRRVGILIGIARNPAVARTIYDSIRADPGARATPVGGVCPVPTRSATRPPVTYLTQTLRLNRGADTLLPVPRSTPTPFTAAQAWRAAGGDAVGDHVELILARITEEYPARVVGSTVVPETQGVLAWVVYSIPDTTPFGTCGTYGLTTFSATTGEGLGSSGYFPGP